MLMSDVLNRAMKLHLKSVHTPDFPVDDWIINPDLTAVDGQPSQYWLIDGDDVTLMDDIEKADVDDAAASDAKILAEDAAAADAAQAIADGSKSLSPAGVLATTEERLRALELKVYGA